MPNPVPASDHKPEKTSTAFLVVDGVQVVVLDKAVITIGRKSDNHIVISNPHVSRYHAQIRKADQRYMLIDLSSTVGTSVNGKRIEHALLKPGDVISIGGVPLIFGQGRDSIHLIHENLRVEPDPTTGPTDATDINKLDDYLSLFTPPSEQKSPEK